MRSTFDYRGAALLKTPGLREESHRRRLAVVLAVMGLALASGVIGSLTHPRSEAAAKLAAGPSTYIPTQ